jgi:hypothetical protein
MLLLSKDNPLVVGKIKMKQETRNREGLERVFSTLEAWHPLFEKINKATALRDQLSPKDEDTKNIIEYFAESDYHDKEDAREYVFEESRLKGRRAYLLSRLDDDIHGLVTRRRYLEQVAREAYAPGKIAFWNEDNQYTSWLKQKGMLRNQEGNADCDVGDLCLSIELPMSLMEAQDLIGNSSWEDVVGRTEGSPRMDPDSQSTQIPKELWYNLDALADYYKTNFEDKETRHSGGIWKCRTDVIQGQPGDVRSNIYAVNEEGRWTAHLAIGNPHNAMYVLGKLVGEDPKKYNILMPFGTEKTKQRESWQVS